MFLDTDENPTAAGLVNTCFYMLPGIIPARLTTRGEDRLGVQEGLTATGSPPTLSVIIHGFLAADKLDRPLVGYPYYQASLIFFR